MRDQGGKFKTLQHSGCNAVMLHCNVEIKKNVRMGAFQCRQPEVPLRFFFELCEISNSYLWFIYSFHLRQTVQPFSAPSRNLMLYPLSNNFRSDYRTFRRLKMHFEIILLK